MFTVLIKNLQDNSEQLFQIDRFEYIHNDGVILKWNDGSSAHFGGEDFYDIFVMNKDGQTVARYRV